MKNRRSFLKLAGATVVGWSIMNTLPAKVTAEGVPAYEELLFASPLKVHESEQALRAKRWAMVIDTRKMTNELQKKCAHICHKIHNVPNITVPASENLEESSEHSAVKDNKTSKNARVASKQEIKWIWSMPFHNVFHEESGQEYRDDLEHRNVVVMCNHCDNPPCVRVCPTKATFRREDGIVMMDMHRCIGCRYCMAACSYGSRSFNFMDPRPYIEEITPDFPTRKRGVVEKCEFCAERLADGKLPACVEASEGTMTCGDLDDPKSEVRKLLRENYTIRRRLELGTKPCVFYII